jgi:hypothetical protein
MTELQILLYVAAGGLVCAYVAGSLRRSEYGVILAFSEVGFLLGCCVYPIAFTAGLIRPGIEGEAALSTLGVPGLGEALHVFLLALGLYLGFESGRALSNEKAARYFAFAEFAVRDEVRAWRYLVLGGIALYAAFVAIAGFDVALMNAAAGRSGEFEGFGEARPWLFLKTLAAYGNYAVIFLPSLLARGKERRFFVLYVGLVIFGYVNSISRTMFIVYIIVPLAIHVRALATRRPARALMALSALAAVGIVITLFGKVFGHVMATYVAGDAVATVDPYESGIVEVLLRNFEYQWFSVRAGVRSFAANGPILPSDIPLSFFGFLPSALMDWVGLGAYRYNEAQAQLACINTANFGLPDCTVPPLFVGYSAYVAPMAGGLVAGFARNFVLGRADALWRHFAARDDRKTWLPYLMALVVTTIFMVIPILLASVTLMALLVAAALLARGIARRRMAGSPPSAPSLYPQRPS